MLLLDTRKPYGGLSVGCEEHFDLAGTGSFYNEGEAEIVMQHVFSLIYAGKSKTYVQVVPDITLNWIGQPIYIYGLHI